MNKSTQQGFTLIELMIVVAIIGILASIALPAYQQYTAKSKFTEVVMSTAGIKTAMEVCAQSEGGFTNCTTSADPAVSSAVTGATAGQYVNTVAVTVTDNTNAKITATPQATGGLVAGDTYILKGVYTNGAVKWTLDSNNSGCFDKGYCK